MFAGEAWGGKFVKWTGRRKVEGGGTGEKAGLEALNSEMSGNHRHKYNSHRCLAEELGSTVHQSRSTVGPEELSTWSMSTHVN